MNKVFVLIDLSVEVKATTTGIVWQKTQYPNDTIKVQWHTAPVLDSSGIVYFRVKNPLPIVTVHSPENKTYYEDIIQLTFIVSEQPSTVAYSLDGGNNIAISENVLARLPHAAALFGNLSLAGLSSGSHNLTLYATDNMDSTGVSKTIYFTLAKETQHQVENASQPSELFSTMLVAVFAVLVVSGVVTSGLLVYYRKRKQQ